MKRVQIVVAGAAAFLCAATFAATDCTDTVAKVSIDLVGKRPGYVVTLREGVSFAMSRRNPSYREVLQASMTSRLASTPVTARFRADGVNCKNSAPPRIDIVSFDLTDEAAIPHHTTTSTYVPAPPTVVTTPSSTDAPAKEK